MGMFCNQCQETAKNQGCTMAGVCGKKADTANLQDLLIYALQGIALAAEQGKESDPSLDRHASMASYSRQTTLKIHVFHLPIRARIL